MSNHSSRIDTQAMHRICQRNETKHLIITVDFAYIMESSFISHVIFGKNDMYPNSRSFLEVGY